MSRIRADKQLTEDFHTARQHIAQYNSGNASGVLVTRLYSAATDNLIRELVRRASKPGKPFARPLAI